MSAYPELIKDEDWPTPLIRRVACVRKCPKSGWARTAGRSAPGIGPRGEEREVEIDLSKLGPYTAGGWVLENLRMNWGFRSIGYMDQLSTDDAYGCKIEPCGVRLILCTTPDSCEVKIQAFGPDGELAEGWTAPEPCFEWLRVQGCA